MQERLEFDNHVDKLQMMIKNKKKEYQEILAMNKDAELAKDSAKDELSYQARKLYFQSFWNWHKYFNVD